MAVCGARGRIRDARRNFAAVLRLGLYVAAVGGCGPFPIPDAPSMAECRDRERTGRIDAQARDTWVIYIATFQVSDGNGETRRFVGSTRIRIMEDAAQAARRRVDELVREPPSAFMRSS